MTKRDSSAAARTPPPALGLSAATVIGLIVGILGFATAIITNSTQLQKIVEDLTYKDTSGVSGEWTALYREYRVESKCEENAGSRLMLQVKRGGVIAGTETTHEGRQRDWKIDGNFLLGTHPETHTERRFINLNYVSTRPERSQSIGSIVLRYDPARNIYGGYVTFYDMDLDQIATYPYLLTKDIDAVAKSKYKEYLENAAKIIQIPSTAP